MEKARVASSQPSVGTRGPDEVPTPEEVVEDAGEEEVSLTRPSLQASPVSLAIEAKVVYMGGHPKKSVYYQGVTFEVQDDAGNNICVPAEDPATGTSYDFSRIDSRGRTIRERLTADGKVFSVCRHIGHLARFMAERDEDGASIFEIRCKAKDQSRIERFARQQLEARRRNTETGEPVLAAMGLA